MTDTGVTSRRRTNAKFFIKIVGLVAALLLVCSPLIYVYFNSKNERTLTKLHVSYKGWYEAFSTAPSAMDFNSSRIVRFSTKADKLLMSLAIAERGHVLLKGTLNAPGFQVEPMDPDVQGIGQMNQWNFVLLPKRSGKQVAVFTLQFVLADGADANDAALFDAWNAKINEANGRIDTVDNLEQWTEIDVVQSWLTLPNIAQLVGVAGTLATIWTLLPKRKESLEA